MVNPTSVLPLDCQRFLNELIEEAESASGTWSLATYNSLRLRAIDLSEPDRRMLVSEIFERLLGASDAPSTCYKLAQILSAFRVMHFPEFDAVVRRYEEMIGRFCEQLNHATMLGGPTIKLLRFLLPDTANTEWTWHGQFQVRRTSGIGPVPRARFAPGPRPRTL
jgi:hypothetical protein